MIARRKVIEEMAESVKTCLSDVQPNLGVVARQNTFSVEDRRRPLAEALLTTHVDVTVHGETGIIKSPIVVRADHDIMSPEETITATEMLAQLR